MTTRVGGGGVGRGRRPGSAGTAHSPARNHRRLIVFDVARSGEHGKGALRRDLLTFAHARTRVCPRPLVHSFIRTIARAHGICFSVIRC